MGAVKKEPLVVNIRKHTGSYTYIGRGSKWGNPFTPLKQKRLTEEQRQRLISTESKSKAIARYQTYLLNNVELVRSLAELKYGILGCFCKPSTCHGDVISNAYKKLNIANVCQGQQTTYSRMAKEENS